VGTRRAPTAAEQPAGPVDGVAIESTSGGLLVDVSGAVRRPGVYRLAPGAHVLDAIEAAGGALHGAQLAALNRAATVSDGQQVIVPAAGDVVAAPGDAGGGVPGTKLSLATATESDLDALPGIGPVTAAKIIADRDANGAFATADDLDRVPGVGPAMVEQLRELVGP